MNNTDLISVIIPTYNRAHLIKRSAQSVLNQTYKNLELIIVDDGSTDNTKEVIDSLNDERIVYIKQENQGAAAARNTGIDIAKGKYIAFQDSDDVWHSDKLEKQIYILKENNADIVFCKAFILGTLRKKQIPYFFKEGFLDKKQTVLGISTQMVIGNKNVFVDNKFDKETRYLDDFELLSRLIKKGYSIYCMDEALVDYYRQPNSISCNHEKYIQTLEEMLQKKSYFLDDLSKTSLELLARFVLEEAFTTTDKTARKKALNMAFKLSNSKKTKLQYFFHKFYVYKIRETIVKSITIPTKKLIKIFRKDI